MLITKVEVLVKSFIWYLGRPTLIIIARLDFKQLLASHPSGSLVETGPQLAHSDRGLD